MTRYGDGQKEQTRAAILDVAARRFRADGVDGAGVAEIMRDAGLTHGGFYAHFKSKDDLLTAAIETMFDESLTRIENWRQRFGQSKAFERYIDNYLTGAHRDEPARGCPIAALGSDMQRRTRTTQRAFDQGVETLIVALTDLLPPAKGKARADLAASILGDLVGALLLARCTADPEASDRILENARRAAKARLA